jgi:hypothetical protein
LAIGSPTFFSGREIPFSVQSGLRAAAAEYGSRQRPSAPDSEEDKANEGDCEISRCLDRARPQRVVERRTEQADHRRDDTTHHRARPARWSDQHSTRQAVCFTEKKPITLDIA